MTARRAVVYFGVAVVNCAYGAKIEGAKSVESVRVRLRDITRGIDLIIHDYQDPKTNSLFGCGHANGVN
ncbi:MAG: hypothetical protein DDT36_01555 [Firmicutes bacterium]|nr:hypothetical protein [Bacillota bacterium]